MYLSEYYCITQDNATYRIDTKKREALHYCSLHVLRLVGMAIAIETSNAKAHADMYVHSYNSNLLMI